MEILGISKLLWIILLPIFGSVLNALFALYRVKYNLKTPELLSAFLGTLGPLLAFVLAIQLTLPIINLESQGFTVKAFDWILTSNFTVTASFSLDRLSAILLLIITGVGTLIHIYSRGYMKGELGFARYYSYLNLFLASMLILVLGENLLVLFVGWEGVGLCSYLLIGFWFEDSAKAQAGKKAFVVNRIGDFGFLIGIFLIIKALLPHMSAGVDILSFEFMAQHVQALQPGIMLITLSLFVGAMGKSAQIPLYVWLPDAMAGPTPVSALIHAATMVTAGIYMMARMAFIFDPNINPVTMQIIATVGAATAFFAATIGLVQNDIKKVLAYSTVSQLGYMVLGVGVGAYSAGVFHLMTHAFFKACLFLGAGAVIYAMHHEQDIRKMGGLSKKLKLTFLTFLLASLAIAGVPPFSGFFSKDEILFQTFATGHYGLYALGILAAGMTAFYMFRLLALTFFGKARYSKDFHVHKVPFHMVAVLMVLALLSVVGGWIGIPHVFAEMLGIHNWWGHFLEFSQKPIYVFNEHQLHSYEIGLAIFSALWALLFISLALFIYVKKPSIAEKCSQKFKALHALLYNKYWVDEFYDFALVQPIKKMSQTALYQFFDKTVLAGFVVKGSSFIARKTGAIFNRLQSGLVNNYVLYFFVALCVLTLSILTWVQ